MEQQDEFTEFTEEQAKWLQENAWWWDYIKDSEQPLLSQTLGLEESDMEIYEVEYIIKEYILQNLEFDYEALDVYTGGTGSASLYEKQGVLKVKLEGEVVQEVYL